MSLPETMASRRCSSPRPCSTAAQRRCYPACPGTWPDWEVNTVYRDTRVNINNPITVLNWGGEWEAPAVGDPASTIAGDYPDYGTFDTARFIWAQPGGGTTIGFAGYTGAGTALFRLQVLA
jgi:hypothetical protein